MTDWPVGSSEMHRRIRAHDWAGTPLGAVETWSPGLRNTVELILATGHAMQVAWGPERIMFYNDAYAPMLGERHPAALGIRFREAWPEIWKDIEPLVDQVFSGETVRFDDMPLLMTRHGFDEETWWNFSYSPVRDDSGAVAGLLNVTVDATQRHHAERIARERDEATALLRDNEARFRALATAGGNSIYRMSADWRTMYQLDSQSLAASTEPIEDWVEKYIPEEDLPFVLGAIQQAIRTKTLFELEHRVRLADGSIGWLVSRAVPLLDTEGRITEWFGAASDVSPRKEMEERLRESQERHTFLLKFSDALRALSEPARIKIAATRLIGEKLAVNRAFYADAENDHWIVTRGHERGIAPLPDRPFPMAAYGDWIIDGFKVGQALIVNDMENDHRFDEPTRVAHLDLDIRAEIALPLVRDGQLVSMVVAHAAVPRAWSEQDLSLLEEAAQRTWAAVERARAEAALLVADRRKDEFLAVLGHELRNGLAPLVYNTEIGNRSSADASMLKELFAKTGRQLHHVVRLVDDLLDVARINSGKIALNLERVSAREIVNLAVDACRADIDRKGHRLAIVEDAHSVLAIHGDRVRLTQVVWNLLSNATKYMDAGGTITVRIARNGDAAVIEVSDTGIGIPPTALPQVFDLFTQVRNQQAYSAGGLGIGLSLVKQLVELQGGRVTATSEGVGRGSTFSVRFPVATHGAAPESPGAGGLPARAPALHVLIVDDQKDSADALAELLGMEGHDTSVAYGGAQALDRVQQMRPDLILLDLGMPGMDGFEVARRLRLEFPAEPRMWIVALTGWGQDADRQQTTRASFDGHLTKPPRTEDLQAVLARAARSA